MTMFNKISISLKRNFGKSSLFLIMTLILGSVVFGAVVISQAVSNTELNLRRNTPPVVTIERRFPVDMSIQTIIELDSAGELATVTLDDMRMIAQLPYVAAMDYSFHSFGWEPSLNSGLRLVERAGISVLSTQHMHRADFIDLNQGLINIVDGRNFTAEEMTTPMDVSPVLVSNELAYLNNFVVGSTFVLDSVIRGEHELHEDGGMMIWGIEIRARLPFEFQVIGIFELAHEIMAGNDWENSYSTATILNRLYTPTWVSAERSIASELALSEIYDWWEITEPSIDGWTQLVFMLYDPLDLPAFEAAASAMLPEFWEVVTLANTFAPMTGAMQSITWMADQIVYFAIAVAVIVLTLVIALMLHGRRHEVGIYLALGERRAKIVVQMMVEVVVNASLGIIIAIMLGNVLARNFSEQLLLDELAQQLESQPRQEGSFSPVWDSLHWFSPGVISLEETMELHEIKIDAETIVIFIGASLLVIMVSSVVPIIYLTKISPKKVLL